MSKRKGKLVGGDSPIYACNMDKSTNKDVVEIIKNPKNRFQKRFVNKLRKSTNPEVLRCFQIASEEKDCSDV